MRLQPGLLRIQRKPARPACGMPNLLRHMTVMPAPSKPASYRIDSRRPGYGGSRARGGTHRPGQPGS
jgi:hypothetical protein